MLLLQTANSQVAAVRCSCCHVVVAVVLVGVNVNLFVLMVLRVASSLVAAARCSYCLVLGVGLVSRFITSCLFVVFDVGL